MIQWCTGPDGGLWWSWSWLHSWQQPVPTSPPSTSNQSSLTPASRRSASPHRLTFPTDMSEWLLKHVYTSFFWTRCADYNLQTASRRSLSQMWRVFENIRQYSAIYQFLLCWILLFWLGVHLNLSHFDNFFFWLGGKPPKWSLFKRMCFSFIISQ